MKNTVIQRYKTDGRLFLRKLGAVALACVFLLVVVAGLYSVAAEEIEDHVIRVAFPIQRGMTDIDADGNYSGYTYDYLQEISQYTGWQYEYVEASGTLNESLSTLMKMLEKGEIDLIGGILYNEGTAEKYEYPSRSYGSAYTTLCVLRENATINDINYTEFKNMRIAVLKKAETRQQELREFCEANEIVPELLYYSSEIECLQALQRGEADAMISVDVSGWKNEIRPIARFAPRPYYFISGKGNKELMKKLDFASMQISQADITYQIDLYEKYFGVPSTAVTFSNAERKYIDQADSLRVALLSDRAPISYINEETGLVDGMAVDVFNQISQSSGLKFEFVVADTPAQLMQLAQDGQVDILGARSVAYSNTEDIIAFSRPYLSSQIFSVTNQAARMVNAQEKRVALTEDFVYKEKPGETIVLYPTLRECLQAVENNLADICYGNAYTVQYNINKGYYKNLVTIPQPEMQQNISACVVKPATAELLTIINKLIRSIPDEEKQAMIYRHTVNYTRDVSLSSFVASKPYQALAIVGATAAVLVGLMLAFTFLMQKASRRTALDNQRYLQLCELSNEFIFEYDFQHDRMTLSEKCAETFGSKQIVVGIRKILQQSENEENKGILFVLYRRLLGADSACIDEMRGLLPTGEKRWFRATTKIICDTDHRPLYAIGKLTDIQKEKEEKDRLIEKTQKDGLTGIYNAVTCRRLISEYLESGGAVLIVDIDWFKLINDQLGHFVGDQVLVETASLLGAMFRKEDIIGRLGGDEFIIFIRKALPRTQIAEKCQTLCEKLYRTIPGKNETLTISVSVGVAIARPQEDFDALYQRADGALYRVKNKGRNGYEIS